jgi:hypothetical protein
MLRVGLHENLVIHKTTINDQGSLVIGVKQAGEVDELAALSSAGQTSFEQPEQDFLIYPPKVLDYSGNPDTVANLMKKIAQIKDPLDHIAAVYLTADKRKWDPFNGTGITLENRQSKLTDESVMAKIYNNLITEFIAMMKGSIGENSKKVRMIFIRQSEAKHYPKLRNQWLVSQPFIESMEIPASASKLKFSDYEKKKGLDNPNPAGGAQVVSTAEAEAATALFSE